MNPRIVQCLTCEFNSTRACMSHGYPDDNIPISCSYKLGVDAEAAMRNLNGTFIDVWTPEHDKQVKEKILGKLKEWAEDFDHYSMFSTKDVLEKIEELRRDD